jgi:hypothetical protein
VVNSKSPPKARRTLVDADAGSPTEEEWPVLKPENVSPPKTKSPMPRQALTTQLRSTFEAVPSQVTSTPVTLSRKPLPMRVNSDKQAQTRPPSNQRNEGYKKPVGAEELRTTSLANRYARSFHTLSTDDSMAVTMVSPCAERESLKLLAVPQRVSSKRISLPLLSSDKSMLASEAPSISTRQIRPGSTKWPILEEIQDDRRLLEISALSQQRSDLQNFADSQSRPVSGFTQQFAESVSTSHLAQSQYGSIDSASTWSMAAESIQNDEPECEYEGDTRIKRLSWHSSSSDNGPVLKIAMEADSILLQEEAVVPKVPAMPENVPKKLAQERSLSHLTGRLSRNTSMRLPGTDPHSSKPNPPEKVMNKHKPVKISPIRAMQPPRKSSLKQRVDSLLPPVSSSSSTSEVVHKVDTLLFPTDQAVWLSCRKPPCLIKIPVQVSLPC